MVRLSEAPVTANVGALELLRGRLCGRVDHALVALEGGVLEQDWRHLHYWRDLHSPIRGAGLDILQVVVVDFTLVVQSLYINMIKTVQYQTAKQKLNKSFIKL